MENLKFWLTTLVVVAALGGLGYFAFTSIDSGSEHVNNQRVKELSKENGELREQIESLEKQLSLYEPKESEEVIPEETQKQPQESVSITYKYSKLIGELQELVNDNISMKLKSRGTRVGTLQNFLNLYNNTSNKVDNDYGESTKKAVAAFQKAVGLSQTGEAGASTFTKMIEWLKKQG